MRVFVISTVFDEGLLSLELFSVDSMVLFRSGLFLRTLDCKLSLPLSALEYVFSSLLLSLGGEINRFSRLIGVTETYSSSISDERSESAELSK